MTVSSQDELRTLLMNELAIIGQQLEDVCAGVWWSLQRDGRVIFWQEDLIINLE